MRLRRFLWISIFLGIAIATWPETVPVTILFTGDFHSFLSADSKSEGGAARIANYYHQVRQTEKNVLILNAGDLVTGTPASLMFKGDPVFHVVNHWGIDASVLGNHEFDQGWQRIEHFRDLANFPLLCGNVFVRKEDGQLHPLADDAYHIFTFGPLRIAVLAVLTETTQQMSQRKNVEGVVFISAKEALQRMTGEVRDRCDLIIALTHVGIENDAILAQEVPGLDLIIGGHSHTILDQERRVNGVPIVHSGSKGRFIGRIDLTANTEANQIVTMNYHLLPVNADLGPEDPDTLREVNHWESQVTELVDRPLGIADESFSKIDMIQLADAAFLEATGADYAHHNSGGTRDSLSQGPFTYREIYNIFPFENRLVTASIRGSEIPESFFGATAIEPGRTYHVVTNSFIRDQIETYFPSLKKVEWQDTGIGMRDAVIRYIEKRKNIHHANLTR